MIKRPFNMSSFSHWFLRTCHRTLAFGVLSCLLFGMLSPSAWAETVYPEEFADFFAEAEQLTSIKINGIRTGIEIEGIVNFDGFRLEPNSQSYHTLNAYLEQEKFKPQYIQRILDNAVAGIQTDTECSGRLVACKLLAEPGSPRYVYDFDNNVLIVFAPTDSFVEEGFEAHYQDPISARNALINNSNLSASYNGEDNQTLNWSNLTTLGLPLGYLTFDSQFTATNSRTATNENDVDTNTELYSALYDVEYEDVRLQAGRSRYTLSFNTTDYLNNGISTAGDLIAIGRSQNLLVGETAQQQQYDYYAPQNAVLEVYRGDDLILTKVVNEGKHAISYQELPSGVYTATISLNVAGEVIQQETLQIVNNNQYVLPVGQWDYVLSAGLFEEQSYTTASYQDYSRQYGRGLVNYRVGQSLFLGGGVTTDENDQYVQLGTSLYWGDNLSLDYSAGVFTSEEWYQTARINYAPFYIDYRQFEADLTNDLYRLSEELYGNSSYRDMAIGASTTVLNTSVYARYSHYLDSSSPSSDLNQSGINQGGVSQSSPIIQENTRSMITMGISRDFLAGRLSVNMDYTDYQDQQDNLNVNISWSKELGSGVSAQVNAYIDQDGFSRNVNSLRYSKQHDNYYTNLSLGAEVDKDNQTQADVSGTLMSEHQYVDTSVYGYLNDSGTQTATLTLSGSQVVTSESVYFTNEKARAYANVHIENIASQTLEAPIQLNVKKDSQYSHRVTVESDDHLVKLDEYSEISLTLDKASNNIELENRSLTQFIQPGTYVGLNSEVIQLLSRTIVFDDIYNEPIDDLTCVGDGCVDVEPLSNDGVYRINYRAGKPIRLLSEKGLCIFDDKNQQAFSHGFCLPSVDKESLDSVISTPKNARTKKHRGLKHTRTDSNNRVSPSSPLEKPVLVYLGVFQQGQESNQINQQLEQIKLEFKRFDIGSQHYYYLIDSLPLTAKQQSVVQQINQYVVTKGQNETEQFGFTPSGFE